MSIIWYLCPYDVIPADGIVEICPLRVPAISRHIPVIPNADGALWDEAEVLGNHIIVKVSAPDALHATIKADADFLEIPNPIPATPPAIRNKIRQKLNQLGFTDAEINATNWQVSVLLDMLVFEVNVIQRSGDTIAVTPQRRRGPKTRADIERRLPG